MFSANNARPRKSRRFSKELILNFGSDILYIKLARLLLESRLCRLKRLKERNSLPWISNILAFIEKNSKWTTNQSNRWPFQQTFNYKFKLELSNPVAFMSELQFQRSVQTELGQKTDNKVRRIRNEESSLKWNIHLRMTQCVGLKTLFEAVRL